MSIIARRNTHIQPPLPPPNRHNFLKILLNISTKINQNFEKFFSKYLFLFLNNNFFKNFYKLVIRILKTKNLRDFIELSFFWGRRWGRIRRAADDKRLENFFKIFTSSQFFSPTFTSNAYKIYNKFTHKLPISIFEVKTIYNTIRTSDGFAKTIDS